MQPRGHLTAIGEFFESVRLTISRTLLNVNVTQGVFKTDVVVSDLCRWYGVDVFGTGNIDAHQTAHTWLRGLFKFLAQTRVTVQFRTADGKNVVAKKVIQSLACTRDLTRPPVGRIVVSPKDLSVAARRRSSAGSCRRPNHGPRQQPPDVYFVAQYWQWKYGQPANPGRTTKNAKADTKAPRGLEDYLYRTTGQSTGENLGAALDILARKAEADFGEYSAYGCMRTRQ